MPSAAAAPVGCVDNPMEMVRIRKATVLPIVAIAVGFLGSTSAYAEPILLASFDGREAGAGGPETDSRVQIVLEHDSFDPPFDPLDLGRDISWEDGDSGVIDFNSDTDQDFDEFAARLTDGVDDFLYTIVLATHVGGGGSGAPESDRLYGSPDLVGNQLDFIRLIVDNVSLEPWDDPFGGGQGVRHDVDLRYEFWGNPVPEPATIALLAFGATALLRRRGRRAAFSQSR